MRSPTEFSLPVSAQHEPVGNDRVPTIRFEEQTKYIKGENTMKGTFKKAVALGSAIALVGGLAACGSSSGDGTAELKFQTWNLKNEKFTDYFEGLIDQFEKENPGITIKWVDQPADNYEDKLSTDAAAGELPDVVDMGPEPAYTLASAGILLNLADAVPEAEDDFLPAAWDAATLKGTDLEEGTYGFPWYLNSGPTFDNKAVLEECGITVDPNDPPTKQDDIFAMADTFGSNCGGKYALTSGIPSIQDFGMYGVELMNKDHTEFTFNNAKGVEFVQHYLDMYHAGAFTDDMLNSSTSGESKSFNGGTQAFMNGNAYSVDDIRKNAPKVFENLAITDFIANTKPNMFMEMLTVNATSKHQEEAIKFARFVTNSDNQLAFDKKANVFPSSKGTIDDKFFNPSDDTMDAEAMRMSADQIRNGEIWGPAQFTSACSTMLREEIAQALQGKITAKEALDATVKYCNERL